MVQNKVVVMGEVVMEDVVMVLGVVVLRGRLGREGRGGGVEVVVREGSKLTNS